MQILGYGTSANKMTRRYTDHATGESFTSEEHDMYWLVEMQLETPWFTKNGGKATGNSAMIRLERVNMKLLDFGKSCYFDKNWKRVDEGEIEGVYSDDCFSGLGIEIFPAFSGTPALYNDNPGKQKEITKADLDNQKLFTKVKTVDASPFIIPDIYQSNDFAEVGGELISNEEVAECRKETLKMCQNTDPPLASLKIGNICAEWENSPAFSDPSCLGTRTNLIQILETRKGAQPCINFLNTNCHDFRKKPGIGDWCIAWMDEKDEKNACKIASGLCTANFSIKGCKTLTF